MSRTWTAFGVASALALAVFAFLPLVLILRFALADGGAPFATELADAAARDAFSNTVLVGLLVTAAAVPLGTMLAWLVERTDLFATELARTRAVGMFALPVAVPPYLLAIAWTLLGNARSGLFNRLTSSPWIDLYGFDGIVLVETTAAYPFVLLAVRAALRRADPSLEEAARISGAGPVRVLADVTLPLMMPAIAGSAGLVFVYTAASFAVPYMLGAAADPPVRVLTTRIYQFTTLGGAEMLERAAALSVVLLSTSVVAQLIASWVARRRSAVQVSGKVSRPSSVSLGGAKRPIAVLVAMFAVTFIVLPLSTIAWTSFQRSSADPLVLTTAHWSAVLGRAETARAVFHSVVLALAAGALVAVIGLVIARTAKLGGRFGALLATAASAPYAVPGTVLAIGLILAFAREVRVVMFEYVTVAMHLPGTLGMLLAAYAVKYLAFGVRGSRAALEQVHPSLEEAARVSGAGPLRGFADVVVPIVSPAVGAAFLLVAMPCLSELTMSVLLFGAGTETAGTLLFELQSYADPAAAAVVATMIVAIVLAGDFVARRLERMAARRAGAAR